MELRSRRRGSDQIDSVDRKGKKPMEDTDTDGKSDNDTDEEYRGGESSKSDSDYEAEDFGGNFPDLNLDPTVSISSSDGEDDDYDLSESRRGKAQSRKRGRKSTAEIEIALGIQDVLHTMALSGEVPFDLPKVIKKEKAKKAKKPALLWQAWEEEHERWIDANLLEDDNLDQSEVLNETAEASSDLTVPLFRYQKEWLAWALKKESSVTRGGILADEMGMGKTIQAIALVLAKRELLQMSCEPDEHSHSPGSSKVLPMVKGTLVVCPLVAASQWEKEIKKFTVEGSTKVLLYHGPKREKSVEQLSEYDFVITTYATVESEYRKHVMPPKEKCPYCGKSFHKNKLTIHLKYYCGPDAIKTEKQSKQSKKKKGGQSSMTDEYLERGFIKKKEEEMCLGVEGIQKSFLHAIKWQRIILDEAHFIKSRHCNTTKAVFALESSYKWALSGTPIQNRVGELYSLVRFLQIVPFSYNLCKDCDCRILDHKYSSSNKCLNCSHSSVRHFCWWNKNIATPVQSHGYGNRGKRAMILLKNKILKSIVLRRTKLDRADELGLPPRIVSLRRDSLDITEQDYYESLYNESRSQFNTYVAANTLTSNYAHIFDLLTRLRQAVDHPYLVVYSPTAASLKGENLASNGEQACGLCHEELDDPVVTSCEHTFCKGCLINYSASLERASCPSCSKLLNVDLTSINHAEVNKTRIKGFRSSSIVNRIQIENFQTSTKIEALREEIRFMIERDGSAKGIVFSQFTSFLDLINYSLQESGVSCVQLIGSMSLGARNDAIKKFTDDPDCKIFLMSLKAGGVALNLTVASHVFLMDPWWNPAVERQAQDRIHRIGQFKPIRIVKFVIENTIEERILKLQEKKQILFEGTIGGSSDALGKLTEADMRFLFVT